MKYYKRFTKTPGNLLTFARQNHWISEALLVICLLLFALTLNVSRAVRADYNHDEDQFITSARLLLDEGMLPYLDYPYFHTPYLVFVYAGLFALTGNYNLLAARLFSAVCATATVLLVFLITLYIFRNFPRRYRYLTASGILLLFLSNPLLSATAGFSWNHNFSVLLMLASLWLVLLGSQRKAPGAWLFTGGVLLGIAVGTRVSSITILPAFLLAMFWWPGDFSWRRYLQLVLVFMAGFGLALLPLAWLMITAPQQFLFGNLGYAQLNSAYRLNNPVAFDGNIPIYGPRSFTEKLGFLWNQVIAQPANLMLFTALVFLGWSVLIMHLGRKNDLAFWNILVLAAAPLVAAGSFLPTPTWYQYFYAMVPFALVAIALGLAQLMRSTAVARKWFCLLLIQLALIASIFMFQDYRRMSFVRYVDLWKPLVIHQVGKDIQEQIGPDGRVFTVGPLYPLEGGLQVYAPMATGVFAYRTGSLLNEEQQKRYGIVSNQNIGDYLDHNVPDGILVGFDRQLEKSVIKYAISRGYIPHQIDEKLTLWVRPDSESP